MPVKVKPQRSRLVGPLSPRSGTPQYSTASAFESSELTHGSRPAAGDGYGLSPAAPPTKFAGSYSASHRASNAPVSSGLALEDTNNFSKVSSSPAGRGLHTCPSKVVPRDQAWLSERLESGLQKLIREHRLLHRNVPLTELFPSAHNPEDIRLGIDGELLMTKFAQDVRAAAPFAAFTDGVPSRLLEECVPSAAQLVQDIQTALEKLGSHQKLRPVFVFNGLGYVPGYEPHIPEVAVEPLFANEFSVLDHHNTPKNASKEIQRLAAQRFYVDEDIETIIIQELQAKGLEVLRAPYFAWPQLSSFLMERSNYISDVYGCAELIAFPNVHRVITSIQPELGTFEYIVKEEVFFAALTSVRTALSGAPCGDGVEFGPEEFCEWVMMDSIRKPYLLNFIVADLPKLSRIAESKLCQFMRYAEHADGPAGVEALGGHRAAGMVEEEGRGLTGVAEKTDPTVFSSSSSSPGPTAGAETRGEVGSDFASFVGADLPGEDLIEEEYRASLWICDVLGYGCLPPYSMTKLILCCTKPDQWRRAQSNLAVLDAPVLTADAAVVPLDVHAFGPRHCLLPLQEVVGSPLPAVLYHSIAAGAVSPSTLALAAHDRLVSRIPFIDSPLYRTVTQRLLGVRVPIAQALRTSLGISEPPMYFYQESVRAPAGSVDALGTPPSKCTALHNYPVQRLSEIWPVCGQLPPLPRNGVRFIDSLRFAAAALKNFKVYYQRSHAAVVREYNLRRSQKILAGEAELLSPAKNSGPHAAFEEALRMGLASEKDSPMPSSRTADECCATVQLKMLDSLGYFSREGGSVGIAGLSLWGNVLLGVGGDEDVCAEYAEAETEGTKRGKKRKITAPRAIAPVLPREGGVSGPPPPPATWSDISEYMVLLIDLVRSGALNGEPIQLCISASRPENIPPVVRFASRLLSILPLTRSSGGAKSGWGGPFEPEIAAFGAVSKALRHTLRETLEALTGVAFVTRNTLVSLDAIHEVTRQLPFSPAMSVGTGNIVAYALLCHTSGSSRLTMEALEGVFPMWVGGAADMWWWWTFWRRAMANFLRSTHVVGAEAEAFYSLGDDASDLLRAADELVESAFSALLLRTGEVL